MPPNTTVSFKLTDQVSQNTKIPQIDTSYRTLWGYFETPLIWTNIIGISLMHFLALYFYLTFPYTSIRHMKTFSWGYFTGLLAGLGVTAGAHRLWSHKSYKAKLPLRIFLGICYVMAGQNSLYDWVRNHRVHHKFSETAADPHNIKRGFFFAHVGWLMMKKRPEVSQNGRHIDCSDILEDPVGLFIERHFTPTMLIFGFIFPTLVPYYCWNETLYWSFMICVARYVTNLNITWSVNSAAHIFGYKPYNKNIDPTENLTVAILALGEGWHNYHHTFPWDYKAAELGNYRANFTTLFIDFCAKLGLAYDLKSASKDLVQKTVLRSGGE